jgi:hypothetical protein
MAIGILSIPAAPLSQQAFRRSAHPIKNESAEAPEPERDFPGACRRTYFGRCQLYSLQF